MTAISQAFRCFDAVARRGSIRKAAETLHLTAAAVNQQILNLEQTVGMPLFDRLPRGVQLTTAGEIMVTAVRRSQRDFDNALSQVEDLRALRRGHVSLGATHSSTEQLIPQVIEAVLDSHPGISFTVRSGNGESLLRWVANGEVDVAFCLRRPPPPGVEEVRAFAQQLGVVTAPSHPLAVTAKPLRMRDCLDYPLVLMSPDMELRTMADRLCARMQQRRPMVETASVPMVRRLVARGDAVGFLIQENVAQDVANGLLAWRPLQDTGARLYSGLYQRSAYTVPVAMGLFVGALEEAVDAIRRGFE